MFYPKLNNYVISNEKDKAIDYYMQVTGRSKEKAIEYTEKIEKVLKTKDIE